MLFGQRSNSASLTIIFSLWAMPFMEHVGSSVGYPQSEKAALPKYGARFWIIAPPLGRS
jgi:hypothetical protein